MIVRVWGIVNDTEVEFIELSGNPGYWEGYAPRVPGLQDIEIWAENDKGARGHYHGAVSIEWYTDTVVRLFLAPYSVHLFNECQNGRDCMPYLKDKLGRCGMGETITEITTVQVGERKAVQCIIESLSQKPFEVSSATFELIHGDTIESSGECGIIQVSPDSVVLSALVTPMIARTIYKLVFTYDIYPEKLKFVCNVRTVIP